MGWDEALDYTVGRLGKILGRRNDKTIRLSNRGGVSRQDPRRVAPFTCGQPGRQSTVEMVALPWHFGFVGYATGGPDRGQNYAVNQLTPMVGDANTQTPEYKVFLVDIVKA